MQRRINNRGNIAAALRGRNAFDEGKYKKNARKRTGGLGENGIGMVKRPKVERRRKSTFNQKSNQVGTS